MNQTQNQKILAALARRRGKWVGLPTLAKASGSLSPATRVSNLRREGHTIENRTEKTKQNGQVVTTSHYRLHE